MISQRPAVACTNGEHYAVPGDCSAFYTCVGGRLSKRKCPTNTKWNQQIKLCDWKSDNEGCDGNTKLSTTESQTSKAIFNSIWKILL